MLEKYPMETMELAPWQEAFFAACGKGDLAAMKALLAENDQEELRQIRENKRGWPCQLSTQAFYKALEGPDLKAADWLLGQGVVRPAQDTELMGDLPLNLAGPVVMHNDWPAVQQLLWAYGADPNARDENGDGFLHKWLQYGLFCEDGARFLLGRGKADLELKNEWGETPFLKAIRTGAFRKALLLMDCGADTDAENAAGLTWKVYLPDLAQYVCRTMERREEAEREGTPEELEYSTMAVEQALRLLRTLVGEEYDWHQPLMEPYRQLRLMLAREEDVDWFGPNLALAVGTGEELTRLNAFLVSPMGWMECPEAELLFLSGEEALDKPAARLEEEGLEASGVVVYL